MEANEDRIVRRFVPDRELVAVAFNAMMEGEDQRDAFVRQHWEAAFGAVRVALDAVRAVWPVEQSYMDDPVAWERATRYLEDAYTQLDILSEEMLGQTLFRVMSGDITTPDHLADTLRAVSAGD